MSDEPTKGRPLDPEEEIFEGCLARPIGERARYLDQVCAGDAALRHRVEELLRSHSLADSFLEEPPVSVGAGQKGKLDVPLAEKVGDRIGRYKLLQQIGEGGCGVVYMAEQEEPVKRRVALKVIKLGMDTKSVIARFEAERQALALMDHPNIAKVFDAGATDKGRPYFVMELVRGVKMTDYCDKNNLPTQERLLLFIQVCRAIQHAHQKGIIHRDIKPSNILVTHNEGVPVPKVIDFGIAKATQGKLTDHTLFTAFEQFIGTPAYMSPEQAEMSAQDIDTRSDLYSLGVLLYELLTGKTPFDSSDLLRAGIEEMRRQIREKEPVRPSTRLSTMLAADLTSVASHRQSAPPKLIHLVRGDLDWIVMKCLEKDRTRRYDTANGLVSDIRRHLSNEPVTAAAPSATYKLQKFVRRHRIGVVAGGLLLLTLLAGIIGSTWGWEEAVHQRREAERQGRIARHTTAFLTGMFESIDPEEAKLREITVREILDQASGKIGTAFPNDPMTELPIRRTMLDIYGKLGKSDAALPHADAALRLAKAVHREKDDPDTARSLDDLADCLHNLGRVDEALTNAEAALAMWQRIYPGDHEEVAVGLKAVGECLHDLGRRAEALPKCEAALAMLRRLHTPDGPKVADCLGDVAVCLADSGHQEEALPELEEVLATHQRIYKADNPSVAEDLDNLAMCLRALGHYDQALPKHEGALAMDLRIYKGDHPNVAAELGNLSDCLQILGRLDEALSQAEAALAMYQRIYHGDNPLVANALCCLGCCLGNLGRWPDALLKHEEALAMWQRTNKTDSPEVAFVLGCIANCLQCQGRYAEALPKFEEALAMDQRIFKGDHPDVATALFDVAIGLDCLDRSTEALAEHQAALEMRQRIYHRDHPTVAASMDQIGLCLEHLGRFDEALARHAEALAMSQRIYKSDNPDVVRTLSNPLRNLALCLERMGRWSEALTNEEASLAMCQRIYAGDHPNTAGILDSIGDSLNALRRPAEATLRYQQAVEMFQRLDTAHSGNNTVRNGLAKSRLKLGDLLAETGKTAEASAQYQSGLSVAESVLAGEAGNDDAKKLRLSCRIKLGLEKAEVVVHKIVPHSQAERVGLLDGDVLISYAGTPVVSAADIPVLMGRATGHGIELEIRRAGAPLKFDLQGGPLGALCEDRPLEGQAPK